MSSLSILVLAAGAGTRMKSALPKVLHPILGKPLLEYVLSAASALRPKAMGVILGVGRHQVQAALEKSGHKNLTYIVQRQPKGSGHAVIQALPWLRKQKGALLVVYGDTPLLTSETLKQLAGAHATSKNAATFLAMDVADPTGYGRMVMHGNNLDRIVEHKDASEAEKRITRVNSGVACWDIQKLVSVLPKLKPNNAKREYYLTDCVELLRAQGYPVGVITASDAGETQGINNRAELAQAAAVSRKRILDHWMREGVTVIDPATTYIDADVTIGPDTRIGPGTVITGPTTIGSNCEILPYCVIEKSVVKDGVKIGPFAHLRPASVVDPGVHIGNFVEIKKARLKTGSKINHLTYIGDAEIGERTNVGAGTITCNYDGVAKNFTRVEADVFIGSNANLVAPVRIGRGAMIAAGSTITENVPPNALAVARSRQMMKAHYVKAWFKKRGKK
jgi:bifunctional UDP-N-acetylglucosamine pyrophosphorylase/glucosamine-1-phosphate N-acetyltransferase